MMGEFSVAWQGSPIHARDLLSIGQLTGRGRRRLAVVTWTGESTKGLGTQMWRASGPCKGRSAEGNGNDCRSGVRNDPIGSLDHLGLACCNGKEYDSKVSCCIDNVIHVTVTE